MSLAMKDIRAKGYESVAPKDLPADRRTALVDAVKYIDRLATMTSTHIADWDLGEVLGPEFITGKTLMDRNEINKRFFEKKEKDAAAQAPRELPKDATPEVAKLRELVDNVVKNTADRAKAGLRDEMARYERQIRDYSKAMADQVKALRDVDMRLAAIEARGMDLWPDLEKIQRAGFWELWSINENHIAWATRNDIVLTHRNEDAGLDIQVNLGKVIASFDTQMNDLIVLPLHNNVGDRQRLHPHVFGDGRICWGGAQDMAIRHIRSRAFPPLLDLLATILVNHNPDSPTYSLDRFNEKKPWNPKMPKRPLDIILYPPKPIKLKDGTELKRCVDCGDVAKACVCKMDF
jgi:hypothetical protein